MLQRKPSEPFKPIYKPKRLLLAPFYRLSSIAEGVRGPPPSRPISALRTLPSPAGPQHQPQASWHSPDLWLLPGLLRPGQSEKQECPPNTHTSASPDLSPAKSLLKEGGEGADCVAGFRLSAVPLRSSLDASLAVRQGPRMTALSAKLRSLGLGDSLRPHTQPRHEAPPRTLWDPPGASSTPGHP